MNKTNISTAVARIVHHVDLTGQVVRVEVEPQGPVPSELIAAAAFKRALKCHPWISGAEPAREVIARQIMVKQIVDLVHNAGVLVWTIDQARPRRHDRPDFVAGYHRCLEDLREHASRVAQRVQDVRPYIAEVNEQLNRAEIATGASIVTPAERPGRCSRINGRVRLREDNRPHCCSRAGAQWIRA